MVVIMIGGSAAGRPGGSPPAAFPFLALRLQGEIDHHDGVLLDDADQEDDADEGDDAEVVAEEQQHQQRPHPAEGKAERMVRGWMKLS
jgi:hypothetical protein